MLAAYEHEGERYRVAATVADPDDLSEPRCARSPRTRARCRRASALLADLYLLRAGEEDLAARVADAELPQAVERVAFVLAPEVDVRTLRPRRRGAQEFRGMHPMLAERMDLWRLREFELERLPSADDIYLFRAQARDNPRDERLVALAEVRDLAPLRDEDGRIAALPELERITREAYEAMRSFQAGRSPRERLHWNRLLLYAWPAIDYQPAEASAVINRFARMSVGLGLEMVQLRLRMQEGDGSAIGCCGCSTPPGAASPSSSASRRPIRSSRSTTARSGSSPRAAAGSCTRPRSSSCSTATSRSTTSTTRASSCPSTARRPPTRRASSSG